VWSACISLGWLTPYQAARGGTRVVGRPLTCAPARVPRPGGFQPGKVSTASLLTAGTTQEGGKTYYEYEVLTRTADGDEGGRHHVFKATVSGGKLFVLKIQAGDKRWFKGVEREAKKCAASFQVV
jgi:hypothetical protein